MFKLGDEVQTTPEALEWGVTEVTLRGRVEGSRFIRGSRKKEGLIRVRIDGNKYSDLWHEKFWELVPYVSPTNMWGE
jgi:hypothetical protein